MNKGEKEIAGLVKEWKDEIKNLATDYNTAISKLAEIKKDYNKKTWFDKILPYIPTFVTAITIIFLVLITIYQGNKLECGISVKFAGFEITKHCSKF